MFDIIAKDAFVICMFNKIVHITFIDIVQIGNGMLHCICKGTSHYMGVSAWLMNPHCVWCLIGWAHLNGTTSNRVARLIEMIKKICVGYQQEGIDPPSGERPPIMIRHSPQR